MRQTGVKNVAVFELDTMGDNGGVQRALNKLTGRSTVPNVFIKGESIGGGDETCALRRTGKLVPMMQQAGCSF